MTWVEAFRAQEAVFRRAPSAHNTQPWVLVYGPDEVAVHWDPARALPDSDPTQRDLFLSLGAFVEACLIAAADAGLAVAAVVDVDAGQRRVARLVRAEQAYPSVFSAAALERRRCARGEYHPGQLASSVIDDVSQLSGAQLRVLPCRELAALLTRADRWLFGTPAVVRELREWLRLSPRHPRYAVDGLTYRAMALSRAEAAGLAATLAPAVYPLARRLGAPALLAAASNGLLRYDGSVLVLVGRAGGPADLVEQGRALLRVWLSLAERDLAVHPLSQLIDCASTAAALRDLLDLGPGESPLAVFRVGRYVEEPVRSGRLPVSETA